VGTLVHRDPENELAGVLTVLEAKPGEPLAAAPAPAPSPTSPIIP
jgi:hypothetical protein